MTDSTIVLKSSSRRTTEIIGEARDCICKRFHRPGILAFGNRRRARQEFRFLQRASGAGLPVPKPRACYREEGTWCVTMDRIVDASTLSDLLETNRRPSSAHKAPAFEFDRNQLLRNLGVLLADLAAAGIRHTDLHTSNLLLDRAGKIWIIDFQQAETIGRRRAFVENWDLIVVCGNLRAVITNPERNQLLEAYWENRARSLNSKAKFRSPQALEKFVTEVEWQARHYRLNVVQENSDRWFRSSGVVESLHVDGHRMLVARDLSSNQRNRPLLPRDDRGVLLTNTRMHLVVKSANRLLSAWSMAAQLLEHRVDAPVPCRMALRPTPFAEFEIPSGTRTLDEVGGNFSPNELARGLGVLLGSLNHRGLKLMSFREEELLITPSGTMLARPEFELRRYEPPPSNDARSAQFVDVSFVNADTRADYDAGYDSAYNPEYLSRPWAEHERKEN